MRHKYFTPGIVLSRAPLSEASALVTLLTPDFGVIRVRAQGLRKPGAKMGAGLQTFAEADVSLVRGKEGWRATGAVLARPWSQTLAPAMRARAARVTDLVQRLSHGEDGDTGPVLFPLLTSFFLALGGEADAERADAAELLAVLRALFAFGLADGDTFGADTDFGATALARVLDARADVLARVNKGIAASGL